MTVSNDAPGVISAIKFQSGQTVRHGQVLIELDSRVERAQLISLQAQLGLARVSAERARALFKEDAVPKAQLDSAESALESAAANAAALQAQIDRKTVRAPFDGRLGIRLVNLGQYLNSGTAITDLQSTDTNFVDFTLPQQQLKQIAVGMVVRINEGLPRSARRGCSRRPRSDSGPGDPQRPSARRATQDGRPGQPRHVRQRLSGPAEKRNVTLSRPPR